MRQTLSSSPIDRRARFEEIDAYEVGRPKFKLKNPIVAGNLELLRQSLFDYYAVTLNTVMNLQNLFTIQRGGAYTPAGGAAFNKTELHTNLQVAGMLRAPEKHLVYGMAIFVRNDIVPADLNLLLGTVRCLFTIQDKAYFDGLVANIPSAGGGYSSTTQTNVGIAGNGWPYAVNLYSFGPDYAQMIEQNQNFLVQIDPTKVDGGAFTTQPNTANPVGVGIRLWVYLHGTLFRAIL